MDQTSGMIANETNQPANYQDNCDYIKNISHDVFS